MDKEKICAMTYAELQKAAKELRIPAVGKKEVLRERILEATKNNKRKAEDAPEGEPEAKYSKILVDRGTKDAKSADEEPKETPKGDVRLRPNTEDVVAKLIQICEKSNDLKYQQTTFGECLKQPLPLRELNEYENFFASDILEAEVYKDFQNFVNVVHGSANRQKLELGVVVQVSGYGKTHLARAYTRRNKAIYFPLSDRRRTNLLSNRIETMISTLQAKYLPVDASQRTGKNYVDFTEMVSRAIEIFILAAIEHYVYFYERLRNNNNVALSDEQVTEICALLYENGCSLIFLDRVQNYWRERMDDDIWLMQFQENIRVMVNKHDVKAIFCDEVHSLHKKYVGMFTHTAEPDCPWGDDAWAQRAAYEQHTKAYPEEKDSPLFKPHIRTAYKRSTSLTYMFVTVLEQVSQSAHIGCILLTTHHAAVDFTSEGSEASRDRAKIRDFPFKRNPVEDIARFNQLILTHFDVDVLEFLKSLPDNDKICETCALRPLYFFMILETIITFARANKPSSLKDHMQTIWKDAQKTSLAEGKRFVSTMESKQNLYWDVVYAVVYHNGYLRNQFQLPINEIDIGCAPVVREVPTPTGVKHRIADYWMLQHIDTIKTTELYTKALEHVYRVASADGPQGEDLMRLVALKNNGQTFSSIATTGSTFHEDSIARTCIITVQHVGDASEFALDEMTVLQEPEQHLTNRLIKVSDLVRPDGLSVSPVEGSVVICAWQSKNYAKRLQPAELESALESLDPKLFFTGDKRVEWLGIRRDEVWRDRYIRVIWATGFTKTAIEAINKYNNAEENITRPIILITHAALPAGLASKFAKMPKKKEKGRTTKKEYFFGLR